MKKRFLSIMLSLGLVAGLLAGCGSSASSTASQASGDASQAGSAAAGDTIKIGVASSNFNDKWQTYLLDGMRAEAKNYPNYEFVFADGNEDANKQIGQVEDFITSGAKGIILIAVNTDTAGPMTTAAKEANIPLVSVNRLLSNQDEATAYVGSESIEAGVMAGEIAFEKAGGKAKVAVLMGPAGNEAAVKRTEGYHKIADEKYPDVEFVAEEIANWNRDEAIKIVENWLQAGVEFDVILSNNDEMALGAVIALEGQGKREGVTVVGVDATLDALEAMKDGKLDGTVYQSATGQGTEAVKTMVAAVEGTLTETMVWVPYEPVTPDVVDEFIAKWQ